MRILLMVTVSLLPLGACTPSPPVPSKVVNSTLSPAAAPNAVAQVDCEQYIDSSAAPVAEYAAVAGGDAALPAGTLLRPVEVAEAGPTRFWAKHGIGVRAGATVELRLPQSWVTRARIGWGSPATPTTAVRVSGCPAGIHGPWLYFAGGFHVDRPACVPVDVTSDGRTERVLISVGAACPAEG